MEPADFLRRSGRKLFVLGVLIVLGARPALAQDDGFSFGAGIHLGTMLGGDGSESGNAATNRMGSGVEGAVLYHWNNRTETRAVVGFTGIRTNTWEDDSTGDGGEFWRSLRFGLEQTLDFRRGDRGYPYVFFGGGVQETWLVRTQGNLAGATFTAIWNLFTDASADYKYTKYSDSLDSWGAYGTAGAGWRFNGPGYIEVRAVLADHQEFATSGLTTRATEPKVYRRGVQCFLTFGLRGL